MPSGSPTSRSTTCGACSPSTGWSRRSIRSSSIPICNKAELRDFHAEQGIVTEAWSPLAQGAVLDDPVITGIAGETGKSPAQVVLRWHLQLGNVVIPKSVTPARIVENTELFDFELSDDHMTAIAGLERDFRTGPHPDRFG